MNKYIRTSVNSNLVRSLIKRYMDIYRTTIYVPIKLQNYIRDNYKLEVNEIVDKIIDSVAVNKLKNSLLEIYIKDVKLKNIRLNSLSGLLEYGNREILPCHYMSKLFSRSLEAVLANLGGL